MGYNSGAPDNVLSEQGLLRTNSTGKLKWNKHGPLASKSSNDAGLSSNQKALTHNRIGRLSRKPSGLSSPQAQSASPDRPQPNNRAYHLDSVKLGVLAENEDGNNSNPKLVGSASLESLDRKTSLSDVNQLLADFDRDLEFINASSELVLEEQAEDDAEWRDAAQAAYRHLTELEHNRLASPATRKRDQAAADMHIADAEREGSAIHLPSASVTPACISGPSSDIAPAASSCAHRCTPASTLDSSLQSLSASSAQPSPHPERLLEQLAERHAALQQAQSALLSLPRKKRHASPMMNQIELIEAEIGVLSQ